MMIHILFYIAFGYVVGLFARMLYPGKQELTFVSTAVLGISGSLIGGGFNYLMGWSDSLSGSGLIMSVIGAVVACWIFVHKDEIQAWIMSLKK